MTIHEPLLRHKRRRTLVKRGATKRRFNLDQLTVNTLKQLGDTYSSFLVAPPSDSLIVCRAVKLLYQHLQKLNATEENIIAEVKELRAVREGEI